MKLIIIVILALLSFHTFAKSALIVVDMQKCFIPGSDQNIHSLPVSGGENLAPLINKIMNKFDIVVATKDWHPSNHISFASNHTGKKPFELISLGKDYQQMLWPDHCVQNTTGAEFVSDLNIKKIQKTINKGTNPKIDSYSGFFDNKKLNSTELDSYLKKNDIKKVYVVGLAADYCVKDTAIDAKELGYETYYISDLTRAVDPSGLNEIYSTLEKKNISVIDSKSIE